MKYLSIKRMVGYMVITLLIVIVLCGTWLGVTYIKECARNGKIAFGYMGHEKRIKKLEDEVKELRNNL